MTERKIDNLVDALVEDILKEPDEEALADALVDLVQKWKGRALAAEARADDRAGWLVERNEWLCFGPKALDLCLIGGNHLGTHKQDYWPEPDADHGPAAEMLISKYGVKEYDIWCCWAAIMRAARLVRGAKVISLTPGER